MLAKARSSTTSVFLPLVVLVLPVFACVCAVQTALAQQGDDRATRADALVVEEQQERVLTCIANDDFDCARASLASIRSINPSTYWNSLAWVEFLDGNFAGAAAAYRNVADLTRGRHRQHALRSVAQLHASMAQFQKAYEALEELLVLKGEVPLAGRHLTDEALWRGLNVYVVGSRDLIPLVPDQPAYPAEAVAQGLTEGYVIVEFTVTTTGTTRDVKVVESSAPAFERSATEAAEKLRYKPRLVDGQPVEAAGVRHRIEFEAGESG